MNIKHMIANAVVRRVVFVLLAALFAWLGLGEARAQSGCPGSSTPTTGAGCGNQGSAYAACMAAASAYTGNKSSACESVEGSGSFRHYACTRSGSTTGCNGQPGQRYYYFPATQLCTAQPALAEGFYQVGSGPLCHNGCAYGGGGGGTGNISGVTLNPGTPQETAVERTAGGHTPTGSTCVTSSQSPSPITQPVCSTVGTLTQCVRPDGKHCATASTGKQFCWSPSENGVKQEGNEGATKSPPSTEIKPPANPPPNGGDWQQTGQGSVTINNNGTTTTTTVTNWSSSYGNQGTGGGSTNGDGTENGNGSGDGDGDGDGNGPGTPTGESLGDLYTPTDKTVESVFENFWNAAQTTAVFNQINAFFGNCGYGGACPSLTYENEYMGRLSFTQLCDGTMADILTFGGFVVLALGAFAGFRIGVY